MMAEVSHVSPIGRPEVGCRVNKTFPKIKNQDHFRHRCCAISCRTKGQKPRQDCFDVLRSVIYLLSAVSHSSSQGFHIRLAAFCCICQPCNSSVHATIRSHARQNQSPTSSSCFTLHVRRALQQSITASGRIQVLPMCSSDRMLVPATSSFC